MRKNIKTANRKPTRIGQLLIDRNISQRELAEGIKCDTVAIHNWVWGNTEPSAASLVKLAKYFNVSTDYLLGLKDEP